MKKITFLALAFLPMLCLSQSIALEKDYMNNLLLSKSKSGLEVNEINNKFQAFISSNPYPEFPYNTDLKLFEFKKVYQTDSISNIQIYNRVVEWVAINFGNISEVLHYGNPDDGKIIVKGYLQLANLTDYKNFWGTVKEAKQVTTGKFTLTVTISNNKIKLEFLNFEYSNSFYDTITNTFIPSLLNTRAESLFPVVKYPETEWKRNLSLIQSTIDEVTYTSESIYNYIIRAKEDYNF